MFQINWNKYGQVQGDPLSVTAIGGGYRETIHTPLHQEENGDWTGHMTFLRGVDVGYEGASKPVRVPAAVVEEARAVALANGVKSVRWNGERFFPMSAEGRVIQEERKGDEDV